MKSTKIVFGGLFAVLLLVNFGACGGSKGSPVDTLPPADKTQAPDTTLPADTTLPDDIIISPDDTTPRVNVDMGPSLSRPALPAQPSSAERALPLPDDPAPEAAPPTESK